MPGLSLEQWLEKLKQERPPHHIKLNLDRMYAALPCIIGQKKLAKTVITIGGTNGKGSTVAYLESILKLSGLQYGSTTSPELYRYNERIRINSQPVSDQQLVTAFEQVEKSNNSHDFSLFEFIILSAFHLFIKQPLDVVLLEVGLGGRMDAVNCIDADIAIITTVDLDHQEYLGHTIELIAQEKAGIIRPDKPIIYGDLSVPAAIMNKTMKMKAVPFFRGVHCHLEDHAVTWDFKGVQADQKACILKALPRPRLPLVSALCAIQAALLIDHPNITRDILKRGVQQATLIGRNQKMLSINSRNEALNIRLDVAHNPQASQYLSQILQREFCSNRRFALLSMLYSKDYMNTLTPLLDQFDSWVVFDIKPNANHLFFAKQMVSWLNDRNQWVVYYESIEMAIHNSLERMNPLDELVVFGSFHTINEFVAACPNLKTTDL